MPDTVLIYRVRFFTRYLDLGCLFLSQDGLSGCHWIVCPWGSEGEHLDNHKHYPLRVRFQPTGSYKMRNMVRNI